MSAVAAHNYIRLCFPFSELPLLPNRLPISFKHHNFSETVTVTFDKQIPTTTFTATDNKSGDSYLGSGSSNILKNNSETNFLKIPETNSPSVFFRSVAFLIAMVKRGEPPLRGHG